MPESLDLVYSQPIALHMMADLFRLEAESAGQVKIVRTADELRSCIDNNIFAAILHFEGTEAIDEDLNALEVFYQAGLRSLGIVWSRQDAFRYRRATCFSVITRYGPRAYRCRQASRQTLQRAGHHAGYVASQRERLLGRG